MLTTTTTYSVIAESHRDEGGSYVIHVEATHMDAAYRQAAEIAPKWFTSCEFARQRLITVRIEEAEPIVVTGTRHAREDGRDCFCGCQSVEGLTGRIVEEYPVHGIVIASFGVPSPAGGPSRETQIAYDRTELA